MSLLNNPFPGVPLEGTDFRGGGVSDEPLLLFFLAGLALFLLLRRRELFGAPSVNSPVSPFRNPVLPLCRSPSLHPSKRRSPLRRGDVGGLERNWSSFLPESKFFLWPRTTQF